MGIDGSGKTTLSKGLIDKYRNQGVNIKYLYARHIPILLYPFKLLSKVLLYKNNYEFKNYKKYSEIKYGFSNKHHILVKLYTTVWAIDYLIFSGIKIYWNVLLNKYLIVDRYIADVVINIAIASRLKDRELHFLLNFFHFFFPKPDLCFFIDVDEEVAFQRKNDIQSVQYLKERKEKYFVLRKYYKFLVVGGHLNKEELLNKVMEQIKLK